MTEAIRKEVGKAVVGQDDVIDLMLTSLLVNGHILLEGVPGTAKTLLTQAFAASVSIKFGRIQFTPDLMPGDVLGTNLFNFQTNTFTLTKGPIFTELLLGDEINRAPPKTQAALLQAMQELEITVGRHTYPLAPPFFVVATQNPVEQEGTYPLPEAQLDRFMFNIPVTYPSPQEEAEIVKSTTTNAAVNLQPILSAEEVLRLQTLVRGVPVANDAVNFAVALSGMSRPWTTSDASAKVKPDEVHRFIRYGASPRASQYLILGAKARAVLQGRFHVDFDDVRAMAIPVLRHRLVLNFHARAENVDADEIIRRILKQVRTP